MKIATALLVVVAACGGSKGADKTTVTETTTGGGDEATPVEDTKPVDDTRPVKELPPPKPLTTAERVAFHDGCFADFIAEKPDFWNRCYSDASTDEMVDGGEPAAVGVDAIKAANQPFWDAFTLKGEIRMDIANGENAVTIAVVGGTQDGEFMGMPPSGKSFALLGAEVQNLDEQGRHGAVRTYFDLGSMMMQLTGTPKGMKLRAPPELTGAPAITAIATGSEAETANVTLIQSGFEMFNNKDWKKLVALYAADGIVSEQMAPADRKGTKDLTKMFKEIGKAFPDAREEVTSVWGAGDYVVAESTFTGTNKAAAPTMGIKKATKKAVSLRTFHVFQIADGKIKEQWIFGNGMAMAMQLGLMKPPAPPAEKK